VKLFLDANVLFTAAHNPEGKSAFVIELAREGKWEVVTSHFALEEARRNLEAKFPDAVPLLDRSMRSVGLVPSDM
jgi:predicted nucleic acid-binding protein